MLRRITSAWWRSSRQWLVHTAALRRAVGHHAQKLAASAFNSWATTAAAASAEVRGAEMAVEAEAREQAAFAVWEREGGSCAGWHCRRRRLVKTFSAWQGGH
jgi:hypothetical protein